MLFFGFFVLIKNFHLFSPGRALYVDLYRGMLMKKLLPDSRISLSNDTGFQKRLVESIP